MNTSGIPPKEPGEVEQSVQIICRMNPGAVDEEGKPLEPKFIVVKDEYMGPLDVILLANKGIEMAVAHMVQQASATR